MALRTPQSTACHLPTAHPSIPSPAQAGSSPLWQGWCFRIFLGTLRDSPQGPGHWSPVPPALFVSQLVSLELPGPWDAPGSGQASTRTGGCARLGWAQCPCPGLPTGLGAPGTRTPPRVPLCQPCTVRATRSREIFHPFNGGKDRRGASCHRPGALGFAPSLLCGCLQCQGSLGSVPGGGSRALVPGRRRMKAAAPLGKRLQQAPLLAPLAPPAQGAKQCKG